MNDEKQWYLLDGTEVLLLEKTASGCIVERVYEGDPDRVVVCVSWCVLKMGCLSRLQLGFREAG